MRLRLLAVLVFVVAGLVVPTAAVTTGGEDRGATAVSLAPHDGPNGEYAAVENGELEIDFDGLNDEAETTAHDVFNVTSTADQPIEVWVETDDAAISAYEGETPKSTLGSEQTRTLQPGETVSVGFRIDTHGSGPDTETVTIGVRIPDEDGGEGGGGGGPDDDGAATDDGTDQTDGETGEETTNESLVVDRAAGVEVLFDGGVDPENVTIRQLESLPEDGPDSNPRAVIDPGRLLSGIENDGLAVDGTRLIAQQNDPVWLTGTQSYVSTAEGIAREPRPAAIVEITPPPKLRDSPALVRIRVAREAFEATDATDARIGRHTPEGWQVLPTRVVDSDEETVLLEARTQGFSVFTVFAESEVQHEWELPDGRTYQGDELRTSFAEPGSRNVTLTVTDAFGRSDATEVELLVNDRPSVTIESVSNATGEETTLRANVTDDYGNTTVTWTLPDGSTTTGETVTGSFSSGDSVSVSVEDEFNAKATAETTLGAGPSAQSSVSQLPLSLPFWVYVLLAVSAVVFAAVAARSGIGWGVGVGIDGVLRAAIAALADDSPRITRLENPRWNPKENRIEIDGLEVIAPSGLLRSVELTVSDADGAAVVERTIDVGARQSYAADPEYVPVYGGFELSEGGSYRLEVRAIDDRDRVGATGLTTEWSVGAET